MPASDILNPTPTDPLNPDYGWTKKRPTTHIAIKASSGPPYRRQTVDQAHQFLLNWGSSAFASEKALDDIKRLKRYYEQYLEDGYFTIVDHEGGGRHHVGYFATPVEQIPVRNNCWAAQNVLFVEVGGAEMVEYPSDWDNDAIYKYCVSDPVFGLSQLQPAPDSFANWTLTTDGESLSGQDLQGDTADAYVQASYTGWGFQFWAPKGPSLGQGELFLDGISLGTIDFYAAAATPSAVLWTQQSVPLGKHVVRLVCSHTKNGASSGYTVIWDALQVMR